MIAGLTAAAFLVTIFLLVLAIRVAQAKERIALYLLIPTLLLFALGTKIAIDRLLGFATGDLTQLYEEFRYLYHARGNEVIYLLAVPQGSSEPRLYALSEDILSEEELRSLSEHGQLAAKGVPIMGQMGDDSALEMYEFDVRALLPKEG